jgi:hypothetical protein
MACLKINFRTLAVFLVLGLMGGLTYLLVVDRAALSARFPSTTISNYRVQIDAENVDGAPEVSLGFNNAEQVVEGVIGTTNMAWVTSDDELQFVVRSKRGAVSSALTLAEGPIILPALARYGDLVAVGRVEQVGRTQTIIVNVSSDGGVNFSEDATLGTGSGISLAAVDGKIIAVWHDDTDPAATQILLSEYSEGVWSSSTRVDESDATPLWASVTAEGENIYVTWRDNRSGTKNVWLRRYTGGVWQDEQNVNTASSADPDICVKGNYVAIAHQGGGDITLLQSTDGGVTFASGLVVGQGFFAHLSCTDKVTAVAWEYSTSSAKATDKQPGWAIYSNSGTLIGSGLFDDVGVGATTVHLSPTSSLAEFLWIQTGDEPLLGTLRHEVLGLY